MMKLSDLLDFSYYEDILNGKQKKNGLELKIYIPFFNLLRNGKLFHLRKEVSSFLDMKIFY